MAKYYFTPIVYGDEETVSDKAEEIIKREMKRIGGKSYSILDVREISPRKYRYHVVIET
jgi:hypothetical protein